MTLLDADTIARNLGGGGVHRVTGAALENAILSENVGGNCTGAPPTVGEGNMEDTNTCGLVSTVTAPNFPNTNPLLGPLQDNGGPTRTMALLPGSPAIDAVSSLIRVNCQQNPDQRGLPRGRPRTNNGVEDVFLCDAGAFEVVEPFQVNTLADAVDANVNDDECLTAGGLCSLRAAIQQANALPGTYVIELPAGNHVLSISGAGDDTGATGDLDIDPPLEIRGAGVGATTVNGGGLDRVFDVGAPPGHVASNIDATSIRDLTITGGNSGSGNGGGILLRGLPLVNMVEPPNPLELRRVRLVANDALGLGSAISSRTGALTAADDRPVRLIDSVVEHNTGGRGALFLHEALLLRSGLLDNLSTEQGSEFQRVELVDSTVSGNDASSWGAFFAQRAAVDSSTIHNNTVDFAPAGVFLLDRSGFRNSIITGNLVSGTPNNCSSNSLGIWSGGHNISDTAVSDCELDDPTDRNSISAGLGALAANGGLARSHLPLAGSPAVDTGDPLACPAVDQRGFPRPFDGDGDLTVVCDVGAVELPEPQLVAGLFAGCALLAGLSRRRAAGVARASRV
jgi:CSLREA domain-containing protein